MTAVAEWMDTDRGPVCGDCWHGCPRPAHWAACDRDDCRCECRERDALDRIGAELSTERWGSEMRGLEAEKYAPPLPVVDGPQVWLARRRELRDALRPRRGAA